MADCADVLESDPAVDALTFSRGLEDGNAVSESSRELKARKGQGSADPLTAGPRDDFEFVDPGHAASEKKRRDPQRFPFEAGHEIPDAPGLHPRQVDVSVEPGGAARR